MSKLHESKKGKRVSKLPPRKNVGKHDEYWQSSEGITVCPKCGNFLYKKEWHHSDDDTFAKDIFEKREFESKKHQKKMCPACTMVKEGLFEGELIVKDFSKNHKEEIVNTIKSFAKRAEDRDPQDRVIKIKDKNKELIITTTENQLAVRLGKHINKVFKKSDLNISYSDEPYKVSRVELVFLK